MNVGIICYASIGGSGVIATELGKTLASRGHSVHILSSDTPFRLGDYQPGLYFHRVQSPSYPLFREPQYLLALANTVVNVARAERLDIVHAHYAIPHATAAYLARQILAATEPRGATPCIITTLHGTDITLLGSDPSYRETVAFCIDQSDAVTAVSASLRSDTVRELGISRGIHVIPNFVDCAAVHRVDTPGLRSRLASDEERILIHVSNFRPVKRTPAVVDVFARVSSRVSARLLMVGGGPDIDAASARAVGLGVADRVAFLGEQEQVVPLLSASDLFLLPSSQESFGLAALEALACGVPVIASRVGGLPEVVDDGRTGFLHEPDDIDGMARSAVALLTDEDRRLAFAAAAARTVQERFCSDRIVSEYEQLYTDVRDRRPVQR